MTANFLLQFWKASLSLVITHVLGKPWMRWKSFLKSFKLLEKSGKQRCDFIQKIYLKHFLICILYLTFRMFLVFYFHCRMWWSWEIWMQTVVMSPIKAWRSSNWGMILSSFGWSRMNRTPLFVTKHTVLTTGIQQTNFLTF